MRETDKVKDMVQAVSRYLQDNPQACDTADGIARWWLGEAPAVLDDLQRALDWLERKGEIERCPAVDGRTRYRRRSDGSDPVNSRSLH
ncbi:MAG TPA: hypothetical protein VLI06_16945 [Solimonas sp.]|nr:hypothetical protein [Solimonas sp.]